MEKSVTKREGLIVLTLVLIFVIKANVGPVSTKVCLLYVNVEKVKEWQNVAKKELLFNVVRNVRKYWIAININVKKIVMQDPVNPAKRKKWRAVIVVREAISLTVVQEHTLVDRFAKKLWTVVFINVKINVIMYNVVLAKELLNSKKHVPAVNMIFKCWLEIHSSGRVVKTLYLFVECLAVVNYNVDIFVLEAAIKVFVQLAKW